MGVSVVVSTHILKDVEACYESVVILGQGRLLVYDELENLCRTVDNAYRVRIDGDSARFASELTARGFAAEIRDDGQVEVRGDDDVPTSVFEVARDGGHAVRHLASSRNSLEEIFLRAVRGDHADL